MDCNHARLLLTFVRPQDSAELDVSEAADLRKHLETCPACSAVAEDDHRADDRLGHAMRDVPLPEGLRGRILNRLHRERDARNRRWLLRAAGVAAAVLIVALIVQAFWKPPVHHLQPSTFDGMNRFRFTRAEDVEKAFKKDFNVDMVAPEELNYEWLNGYHMALIQDRRVPYLVLMAPTERGGMGELAHVFIFHKSQFDREDARTLFSRVQSGKFTVKDFDVRYQPDYFYVMIYTGLNREAFLKKQGQFH